MRVWVFLLAVLLARPAWGCEIQELTRVPLPHAAPLVVEVEVNGQPARFVLDTGAQRSVVTRAAVARLGLALSEWVATNTQGIGGVERNRNALPWSIRLGGVPLERRTKTRDTSLVVATLPRGDAFDGLLGRDFLSGFDLLVDMPAGVLTLFRVSGCAGAFLPKPWVPLEVVNPAESALVVMVTLDEVRLRALLDTGADMTVLAAPGMARMRLDAAAGGAAATASGAGPREVTLRSFRFGRMVVGPEVMDGVTLWAAPFRVVPVSDLLLGADWLAGRRVWVSFGVRGVFVVDGRNAPE